MQNNNASYDKDRDIFGKLVSSKLEDHRMPVDPDSWTEIEKRIKPKRRKSLWWYLGSAAAIVGLLLVFFYPLNEIENNNVVAEFPTEETPTIKDKSDKAKIEAEKEEPLISNLEKGDSKVYRPLSSSILAQKGVEPEQKEVIAIDTPVDSIEKLVPIESDKREEEDREDISSAKDTVRQKPDYNKLFEQEDPFVLTKEDKLLAQSSSNNNWSFGLATNIRLPKLDQNNEMTYDAHGDFNSGAPSVTNPGNSLVIAITEAKWDVDYKQPISVGFKVSKNLNQTFSLETGLIYTYLSSNIERSVSSSETGGIVRQEGELNLHYLGVPVDIVGNIWSDSKWSIYGSGGVMLEKGISMNQKISTKQNGFTIKDEKHRKTWVSGLQWSLNGAVGISYNLSPSWGLYVEPRVSYYFDNRQPVSIRSEKNAIFNFNAGVKFNL